MQPSIRDRTVRLKESRFPRLTFANFDIKITKQLQICMYYVLTYLLHDSSYYSECTKVNKKDKHNKYSEVPNKRACWLRFFRFSFHFFPSMLVYSGLLGTSE